MTYHRLCRRSLSLISTLLTNNQKRTKQAAAIATVFLTTLPCLAQDQPENDQQNQSNQAQVEAKNTTVTIPAGTRLALVLTQPIQSRNMRRGDDIYAQITSPVNSGNETVIPPGTFVQGSMDKIERKGRRGELRLQSMAITFPDGYVVPIAGPSRWRALRVMQSRTPGHAASLAP